MRRAISIFGIAVLFTLSSINHSPANVIGVFADEGATSCDIALGATYGNVAIHYVVLLTDIPALTAVEFGTSGIDQLIAPAGWVPGWASPLVIDNPASIAGGSIAFSSPQAGPMVYLGNISTFDVADNPNDVMLCVVPTESGDLKIVDDAFLEFSATGWCALVNCTLPDCGCPPIPGASDISIGIASPTEGQQLQGTHNIEFNVSSYIDGLSSDFTGTMLKDGITQEVFSGSSGDSFTFQGGTENEGHGSSHTISVEAANDEVSDTASVTYTIDDTIAPEPTLLIPGKYHQFNGGTLELIASASDFQGLAGMSAEFYLEEVGTPEPINPPILEVTSSDGTFEGFYDFPGEIPAQFDIGFIVEDVAGNRSEYLAHTVYFYPLNYRITIDVDHESVHDWGAVAGVLLGATDGYDPEIDLPEPPTPPLDYVSCYFPHPEWGSPFGDRFNADVREDSDFMGLQKTWDFTVETDQLNEDFTCSLSADPAFIDSLPTYIADLDLMEYYNLHEVDTFTFNSGESGVRHFQLVIGPSEALPASVATGFSPGWNMASVALDPVNTSTFSILDDDIDGSYFLYGYDMDTGYLPSTEMIPTKAYWLGLFAPDSVDVSGSALVDTISAALPHPWQMIGTSLYKNIALDQARVRYAGQTVQFDEAVMNGWISPAVYGWDNGSRAYEEADTLEIWQGYWVGQLTEGLEILFHKDWGYIPIGGGGVAPPDVVTDWKISLEASAPDITERVYLGMHPEANRGFDVAFDYPKPPISPGGASIYLSFDHPTWRCILGDHFNRDIRHYSIGSTPEIWTVRIYSENESTVLTWPYWDHAVPENLDFLLDNPATPEHEWIDLRHDSSYELVGPGVHEVTIAVGVGLTTGTSEFAPESHALHGNHPNPFNPATMISFAVKEQAKVRLDIYSSDGRHITTLLDEVRQSGHHQAVWRGIDDQGNRVSSGVYLARLKIDDQTFSEKLMLLK